VPARELDLVVGELAEPVVGRLEREQVVAALLQDAHGPTGLGEHVGRGAAAGPGADDDDVEVRHR
jgi:hypothetical protein